MSYFEIPYSFPIGFTLRPDIKVEFTFTEILQTDELEVITIIEDNNKEVILFIPLKTNISIDKNVMASAFCLEYSDASDIPTLVVLTKANI